MHWIDPDYLPEVTGTVDQFLVNKHGEADGFLLTDGGEVHVPPHLSSRLLREVRPGGKVRVRGVRPRGVQMVAAVAIDTEKGRILDEGPDVREDDDAFERAEHSPMSAQGCRRTRRNAFLTPSREVRRFRSMATAPQPPLARRSRPVRSERPPKR
jgi:hypothetical protein